MSGAGHSDMVRGFGERAIVANQQTYSKIESRKKAKPGTFFFSLPAFVWNFVRKIRLYLKKMCVLKVFIHKNR